MAREALSARIDGEREPVPAARVDEHLELCADCAAWLEHVTIQSAALRRMAQRPVSLRTEGHRRSRALPNLRVGWQRWALLGVGVLQIVVAVTQAFGVNVGLTHGGMGSGGHLLNESTAWSIALGVVMVAAAVRPAAAAGLAGVLGVFVAVLTVYVVVDAMAGAVTATRVLTHVPVALGAILAVLVWRRAPRPPETRTAATEPDIVLPHTASRGRRRGHLWPTDGSAA